MPSKKPTNKPDSAPDKPNIRPMMPHPSMEKENADEAPTAVAK